MIDCVDIVKGYNILVLYNEEIVERLVKHYKYPAENITFVTDSLFRMMRLHVNNIHCKTIYVKHYTEIKKEIKDMNFDYVISNPPYGEKNVKLDLNILKSIFSVSKKIIFIHPSTFIFDKKFKWKQYNDIRNTNYLEKIITIWGNELFNIKLFCPLCISIWNTDKITDEVEVIDNAITKTSYKSKINDVCIHGNSEMITEFFNKIQHFININGHLHNHTNIFSKKKQTNFSVRFAVIRGNAHVSDGWKDDFFSLFCKDYNENLCDKNFMKYNRLANTQKLIWSFDNEEERMNFVTYCKSKFARFCLSYLKENGNLANGELESVPWLDFKKHWNDKTLKEYFNISNELYDYIDHFIPDYYSDYKFDM